MEYSVYEMADLGVWVGTHRLPIEMAIRYCKELRRIRPRSKVALVPDGSDPYPYFLTAMGLPHRGGANPDVEIVKVEAQTRLA